MNALSRFQRNQIAYEGHTAQRGGRQRADNPYSADPDRAKVWDRGFELAQLRPGENPDPPQVNSEAAGGAPQGVGGWLLLLVIGLTVLGPLRSMASLADFFRDINHVPGDSGGLKAFVAIATVAACALSIAAGWVLMKWRTPKAVAFAKAMIWVIGPAAIVVSAAGTALFSPGKVSLSIFNPGFLGMLTASIVVAAIWTIYLSVSKRVKATYGIG